MRKKQKNDTSQDNYDETSAFVSYRNNLLSLFFSFFFILPFSRTPRPPEARARLRCDVCSANREPSNQIKSDCTPAPSSRIPITTTVVCTEPLVTTAATAPAAVLSNGDFEKSSNLSQQDLRDQRESANYS